MSDERCPRCSSKAYDAQGCISCGHIPESGNGDASGSEEPVKKYSCRHCGKTCESSQSLAGHVANSHKGAGESRSGKGGARKKKSRRPQPAGGPRARADHAARTPRARPDPDQSAPAGPPGNGSAPCCPMCRRELPAPAMKIARQFVAEGLAQDQAARLALIAQQASGSE